MSGETFLTALLGGVVGGVFGWIAAVVSSYWGPRWLEEWRDNRSETLIHGPRKDMLRELLADDAFEWRTLRTLARASGTEPEECRRLLIEIGARGSTGDDEELWGLLQRHPISER
jgi:hypothetical protein